jgi:hypothetical protein
MVLNSRPVPEQLSGQRIELSPGQQKKGRHNFAGA